MNKKAYQKPALQVVNIQHLQMFCASTPKAYNEVSSNASYTKRRSIWDEGNEEEEEHDLWSMPW